MNYLTWVRQTVGEKWVVAARTTPRIKSQYPGAVVITPKRMKALDRQYRILYGDPYDKQRAAMYLALKTLIDTHAKPCFQGDPFNYAPEWKAAMDAVTAEADAR